MPYLSHCPESRLQKTIQDLDQVINTKLLKPGRAPDRAVGRIAWALNKQKLVDLRNRLKEECGALSTALCADLLWLTQRIESNTATIMGQTIDSHSAALSMDRRLGRVETITGTVQGTPSLNWTSAPLKSSSQGIASLRGCKHDGYTRIELALASNRSIMSSINFDFCIA
ncbi:hypothetical protein BCR34DRAFT_610380 [Clohesyomyces aquaticus]|uniref:Uncharacterized protein n=1 Tax=Clohesyomyces aquaticus TaxID=1231657 RepID=A0A1Y2A8M8_9PLEO|nr:hypothetical protein BCR34DRAFT_610380 [Clohesyomyces aquaticus]